MKIISGTLEFCREVGIALRQIRDELFRNKKRSNGPSEQYLQFTKEVDGLAEDIVKNGESLGKAALELARKEGLLDHEGFVTQKGKSVGLTPKMINPFGYKPTGLN